MASALAASIIRQKIALRQENGSQGLVSGMAGWIGMECLYRSDGNSAWLTMQEWHSQQVIEAFGALKEPITQVAKTGTTDWIESYSSLTTLAWASQLGTDLALRKLLQLLDTMPSHDSLAVAFKQILGEQVAQQLMGVPVASDIELIIDDKQSLKLQAQRWNWQNGGWKLIDSPEKVVRLSANHQIPGEVMPISSEDIRLERPYGYLLDQHISFERTPANNTR